MKPGNELASQLFTTGLSWHISVAFKDVNPSIPGLHGLDGLIFGGEAIRACGGDVAVAAGHLQHHQGPSFIGVNGYKGTP